jgi:galactokinase/mevalonate kinase-like predicted kinase
MFYVEPENQSNVIKALNDLYHLKVNLDTSGTRITYYDRK